MSVPHRSQAVFVVLLMVWGAVAIITQSLLLRETLVLFFAGEISWGIVLFAWLAGVGLGAALGGRLIARTGEPDRWLASLVATFALAGPVCIVLLRGARGWLDVGPGQYIPLGEMVWLSALLVTPFGLLIGGAFPLACKAARGTDDSARIGWVYWVESAGSLVGGLAFTFLLAGRVGATAVTAGCGVVLLVVSGVWLLTRGVASPDDADVPVAGPGRRDVRFGLALVIGACALAVGTMGLGDRVEDWSVLRRWRSFARGLELRDSIDSRYQNLALGWREGQFQLYANGHPTTTFPEPVALRWPGQVAMCQHPAPRRVLLLGGGADGMLAEVLTHRCVERVDYVELDPVALRLARPHLPTRDRHALSDERVHVVHDDVRRFVQRPVGPYDLIIGRFGVPASALTGRLYTREFYRRLSEIMTSDGVLAFATETSPAELHAESAACTGAIYATLRRVFADVLVGWGPNPMVLACRQADVLTSDLSRLGRRLALRGVSSGHFAAEDFAIDDQLAAPLVAKRRAELASIPEPVISTDLHPRIYLLWLQRWEQQMQGRGARHLEQAETPRRDPPRAVFAWIGGLTSGMAGVALLLPWPFWLTWRLLRHGRRRGLGAGMVLVSLASTGLVAMAGEIVLLFAYQSLSGYAYEQLGAIIGLFMLGLVLGSGLMNRMVARQGVGRWWLVGIDLALAALLASTPAILGVLGRAEYAWVVTAATYGLIALLGVLGGASFPTGARLHVALDGRANRTAGEIDAADHLGGCVGALLTGAVLVPAIGIGPTCLWLAALKALSAAGVAATARSEA